MDEKAIRDNGNKKAWEFGVGKDGSKTIAQWFDSGLYIVIKVVHNSHFCTYLGVPDKRPSAGHDYDDISFIDCHGGFTYSDSGGKGFDKSYHWYGYDYAHLGDMCGYNKDLDYAKDEKAWTLKEVCEDAWSPIYEMKKFMTVAEKIYNSAALAPTGAQQKDK